MKILNKLILIAVILICAVSCRKDELPKPTQEGNGSFGMLIDGVLWEPYKGFDFLTSSAVEASYDNQCGSLNIKAKNKNDNSVINLNAYAVFQTGVYGFSMIDKRIYCALSDTANYDFECIDSTFWTYNGNCKGSYMIFSNSLNKLVINKLDTSKRIISGTFELSLKNQNKIVNISEGRFDLKF